MSTATSTTLEVANTILRQIGTMTRGCLDMKGSSCFATDSGVIAKNVLVGPRKRGDIEITLNGADLYDIEVSRTTIRTGKTVLREWDNVYADQLSGLLDSLWR